MEFEDNEDYVEDELRSAEEIAKRALVLASLISVVFEGQSISTTIEWLKHENLWSELVPSDLAFINDPSNQKLKINLSWRSEALVVLLWSINKLSSLPALTEQCDTTAIRNAVIAPPNSTKEFIASAKLRSEEEIGNEYEVVYESHWSVRDAQISKKKIPNNLEPGVVYERHFGFNYVTGYDGLPWDEITTDT